jgi:hypothetical protein
MFRIALTLFSMTAALLAISIWYAAEVWQIDAAEARFERWARAQRMVDVEFVVTAPGDADDAAVYLCGSAPGLRGWEPAGVPLQRAADGKYRALVKLMSGVEHAFRLTRGSSHAAEVAEDGTTIAVRTTMIAGAGTVEISVAGWDDAGPVPVVVASPVAAK